MDQLACSAISAARRSSHFHLSYFPFISNVHFHFLLSSDIPSANRMRQTNPRQNQKGIGSNRSVGHIVLLERTAGGRQHPLYRQRPFLVGLHQLVLQLPNGPNYFDELFHIFRSLVVRTGGPISLQDCYRHLGTSASIFTFAAGRLPPFLSLCRAPSTNPYYRIS